MAKIERAVLPVVQYGGRNRHRSRNARPATDRTAITIIKKETQMGFLKRRISASVWELLLLLVAAVIFATVYRVYFSRA